MVCSSLVVKWRGRGDAPVRPVKTKQPAGQTSIPAAAAKSELVRRAEAAGLRLEHPQHHPRVREQEVGDLVRRDVQASERRPRDDVGDRLLAQQRGDLAEEASLRQHRELLVVQHDTGLSVHDHVQADVHLTAADDPLSFVERDLSHARQQVLQLVAIEIREERQTRGTLDEGEVRSHPA